MANGVIVEATLCQGGDCLHCARGERTIQVHYDVALIGLERDLNGAGNHLPGKEWLLR